MRANNLSVRSGCSSASCFQASSKAQQLSLSCSRLLSQRHTHASPPQCQNQYFSSSIVSRHSDSRNATHSLQRHRQTTTAAAGPSAATPVTATEPADPCLDLSGIEARAVGALIGSMCGNALGAQVEPEKHYRIARLFPHGLHDMSWSLDISPSPLPAGHVTGDYITMLAVALSLARKQGADTQDIINCLASSYMQVLIPGNTIRYSPYTELALESLAVGTNPFLLSHHVEHYMSTTPSRASQSCSHRPDRQLHGISDFTAVIRAVPVGIAYRDARSEVLGAAVDAAVLLTHPSEQGREGAAVIAAAVAWLIRVDPASSTPEQLLSHLLTVSKHSPDMMAKLQLLQERLPLIQSMGLITNWSHFWTSHEWLQLTATANLLWKQNLAVQGTQAAAIALWVVLASWYHPKQAVMLAASLGGYAGTTGALVGALVGALHGSAWIPQSWWSQLQDEVVDAEGMSALERAILESESDDQEGDMSISSSPRSSVDQPGQPGGVDVADESWDVSSSDFQRGPGEQQEAEGAVGQQQQVPTAVGSDTVDGGEEQDDDEEGEEEQQNEVEPLSELRVGKFSVVALGQCLAGLSCTDPPQLMQ